MNHVIIYLKQKLKRILKLELAEKLEHALYDLQRKENYYLDNKKFILNNSTIIIMRAADSTKRLLKSDITVQLELELYCLQCKENYYLDTKKLILNNSTIIIMGAADSDLFRKKVKTSDFISIIDL